MHSENDWRLYQGVYTPQETETLNHSDTIEYSENDYRLYLEHKFTLPKIDFSKVAKSAKNALDKAVKSVTQKTSSKKSETTSNPVEKVVQAIVKPAKWEWPNGKNSKPYNAWYYQNNKEKWGVKGTGSSDTTREIPVKEEIEESEDKTPLNDVLKKLLTRTGRRRLLNEALSKTKIDDVIASGLKSFNKYAKKYVWDKTNVDERVIEGTKALIDEARWAAKRDTPWVTTSGLRKAQAAFEIAAARLTGDNEKTEKLIRQAKYRDSVDKGKYRPEDKYATGEVDPATGFALQKPGTTRKYDLERVNPKHDNWDDATKKNCTLCAITYDLRQRGYDVEARNALGMPTDVTIKKCYPDAKIRKEDLFGDTYTERNYDKRTGEYYDKEIDISDPKEKARLTSHLLLKENPDGARGTIWLNWDNGIGGHMFSWEIKNGRVVYLDPQTGKVLSGGFEYITQSDFKVSWARLDNCDIDQENIKRVAKSYGQ